MKLIKLSIAALSLTSSLTFGSEVKVAPKFWVNEAEKTVVIAANPTLTIRVTKLEVDETYYAKLDINLSYLSSDVDGQSALVMKDYADYKVQRAVLEKNGTYQYRIPLLSVDRLIDPRPGSEGPYFEDEIYLNREKYRAVLAELRSGRPLVQVSGTLAGTVPMMKVVERKEIDSSVCEKLLGPEHTVGSSISKMASIARIALNAIQFEYDNTRVALLEDVKKNCFEISSGKEINSFADVLALNVRANRLDRKLFGETLQKSYDRQVIPLSFQTRELAGGQ